MTISSSFLRRAALAIAATLMFISLRQLVSGDDLDYSVALPLIAAPPALNVVADEAALREAILEGNEAGQAPRIELAADILLTEPLPALDNPIGGTVTVAGNGHSLDGGGHGPVLSVASATWVVIDHLTLRGGVAECGGGLYTLGRLTVRHSQLLDNQATDGGGICVRSGAAPASLTLENTVIAGNVADAGGGGIHAATGNAGCVGSCVVIHATDVTMADNSARTGGGIVASVEDGARLQLVLTRSHLTDNSAQTSGGALYSATHNGQVNTTISRSAITGNEAGNDGGGIFNYGYVHLVWYEGGRATLDVLNSTLSGNVAGGYGGAIESFQSVPFFAPPHAPQDPPPFGGSFINMAYSTLADNTALFGGGLSNNGNLSLMATILTGNPGGDCLVANPYSFGHNLDGDNSCGLTNPTDLPSGVADLLPLALNPPGTTPTHALGPASAARDHIPLDFDGCSVWTPNPDQRGVDRPQPALTWCDIGAYEADAP